MATRQATDWVSETADRVIAAAPSGAVITCASGLSPSGPVHLGNLREIMVPHFIAEEIRGRGVPCRHLLSWDDFDRLRKVPAGVPADFADHLGRPLSRVPDPFGDHDSWADRFKAPLREAMTAMGIDVVEVSQTHMYESGAYREQILQAVAQRDAIESILGRYRTKVVSAASPEVSAEDESTGVADEDEVGPPGSDLARFPFRPYCAQCGRDTTVADTYGDDTSRLAYTCQACRYHGTLDLSAEDGGKLVWKVDWPMRWAHEHVTFEAAGVDHSSPGSSFTVGAQIVRDVFSEAPPVYLGYSFVGVAGMAKMSSSAGAVPIPRDALEVLEAPLLRWLYARRKPAASFTIDLGQEVVRLYDEWDALGRRVATTDTLDAQGVAYERASQTSLGRLPTPEVVVPFRTLSSIVDVTAGSAEQVSRIVGTLGFAHTSVEQLEPRLGLATSWIERYVDDGARTQVRGEPDTARLDALSEQERAWLTLLLEHLDEDQTLAGVTRLVYGVPKLAVGLDLDADPTPEVATDQKALFRLLYQLLIGKERGPRLPTLFLALGPGHLRELLAPPDRP